VVNNSWGGDWFDPWYQAYVRAWVAAGIFPAFSAGNDGAACSTVGSPGDYVESYSTGTFDVAGNIAEFSSRGPAVDGAAKPDIAAPGVSVRSSMPGDAYGASSGTSMASPHTAATVALMWSAAPALVGDIPQTIALLDRSAADVADLTCGGQPGNNNVWGEGRLDAYAAVELAPTEDAGLLKGTVTDASTGLPIEGVTVELSGRMTRRLTTDAAGYYQARLASGVYDVLVSKYGYLSQSVTGLILNPGADQVSDFALQVVPAHRLDGYVRNTMGNPISDARVTVLGTPLAPAITDASGYYSFAVILEGTHTISAAAGGCANPQSRTVDVTGPISDFDFTLELRTDAFGYTCVPHAPGYIEGDATLVLSGDDYSAEIDLPFAFPFYEGRYTRLWVSTNGALGFGEPSGRYSNAGIPDAELPNNAVFAFWDDLYVDYLVSGVYTRLLEAPRRFVIEWRGAEFYSLAPRPPDFEVILYQDGQIVLQYRNVGATSRQQGGSATIGIENSDGSDGLAYSYNSAALNSPVDAIRYRSPSSVALDNIIYLPLVLRHSQ
jgi:subtilisin family serine protease